MVPTEAGAAAEEGLPERTEKPVNAEPGGSKSGGRGTKQVEKGRSKAAVFWRNAVEGLFRPVTSDGNEDVIMTFLEPTVRGGKLGIELRPELVRRLESKWAGTLLFRRFASIRANQGYVKGYMKAVHNIPGDKVEVQLRPNGVFLVQFRRLEDYVKVKEYGDTWIGGSYTVVRSWTMGRSMERESFKKLPIWVILPNFPRHLWDKEVFDRIASFLGRPIRLDLNTARASNLKSARFLVEMDAGGDFPDHCPIFLTNEEGEETEEQVRIWYHKPPPRCGRCSVFGHWTNVCKVLKRDKDEASRGGEEEELSVESEKRKEVEVVRTVGFVSERGPNGRDSLVKLTKGSYGPVPASGVTTYNRYAVLQELNYYRPDYTNREFNRESNSPKLVNPTENAPELNHALPRRFQEALTIINMHTGKAGTDHSLDSQ